MLQVDFGEEEQHIGVEQAMAADLVLSDPLGNAESATLSASPSSTSLTALPPGPASPSAAGRVVRASSSAGLGRAESADASLEALLAELSSANPSAAAALAPFTSSSAAAAAAAQSNPVCQLSPSSEHVQEPAEHSMAQHATAQHGSTPQSPVPSSQLQLPATSAFPPSPLTSDLTAQNISYQQADHMSAEAASPSSASVSPQSSSPALVAAQSVSSLSPRSSSPSLAAHPGSQFVAKLQGELQQHQEAFNDDLAFIQEVQTHQTLAAGMNPNLELQSLHKRFNNWKFDFKVGPNDDHQPGMHAM